MRVRHGCLVGTLLASFLTAAPASAQPIEPLGQQLRLTQIGDDGDALVDAGSPDVAYNSLRDEYLVVWVTEAPVVSEIWGRRLHSDGSPAGAAFRISASSVRAYFPAVAYDPERDRYGVAYVATFGTSDEVFIQRLTGAGTRISADGDPGGPPTQASTTPGGNAHQPDIVYRADASGDDTPGDRWVVSYTDSADQQIDVSAVGAVTGGAVTDRRVSDMPGGARYPSLAVVPGTDDLLVAWEGVDAGGDAEIWVNRVAGQPPVLDTGQAQITVTGGASDDAFNPSVTVDPHTNRFLVAYSARESTAEGVEVHVQRIDAGLGEVGSDDQQVSSAGPVASGSTYTATATTAAYHPALRRYLVTWIGQDSGRPGYDDHEYELTGTVLDADGAEGDPQDFPISHMGTRGSVGVGFDSAPATAVGGDRWLTVWDSDGERPPLADDEYELFGRLVAAREAIPGEAVAGDPRVAPPANLTSARLVRRFRVRDTHTRVRRLAVVGATPGMRIELRCRGRGCTRKLRRIDITRTGTVNLKRFLRRARLRPGAVLVVRILEPGAIGRVERLRIRDDRAPSRRRLCLPPGTTTAGPC